MVLPLDLREQFLEIVQVHACSQSQFVGAGAIRRTLCGILNRLQTSAKRLIYNPPEGRVQPLRNRSRRVEDVIVYSKCCSHGGIIASSLVMSTHHSRNTCFRCPTFTMQTISRSS